MTEYNGIDCATNAKTGNLGFSGLYRVRIRRDWPVKPEAEQIDGKVYRFDYGWRCEPGDRYAGEHAMIARDPAYPIDAPWWVASGDLEAARGGG